MSDFASRVSLNMIFDDEYDNACQIWIKPMKEMCHNIVAKV